MYNLSFGELKLEYELVYVLKYGHAESIVELTSLFHLSVIGLRDGLDIRGDLSYSWLLLSLNGHNFV